MQVIQMWYTKTTSHFPTYQKLFLLIMFLNNKICRFLRDANFIQFSSFNFLQDLY